MEVASSKKIDGQVGGGVENLQTQLELQVTDENSNLETFINYLERKKIKTKSVNSIQAFPFR